MTRLLVHVEGQTEEDFVNEILAPHLYRTGYTSVGARLLGNARQRNRRGGIRSWDSVRRDILNHLLDDQTTIATTMVDYYALPHSWPGREQAERQRTLEERASFVEQALLEDISGSLSPSFSRERFVPYVVMHEFEGLLFSDPDEFALSMGRPDLSVCLREIRGEFHTPEEINDSPSSAPYSRIIDLNPAYQKPLMGVQAMQSIGLDVIREQCVLFDEWIAMLEQRILN